MKENMGSYKISPYIFHRIIKWVNIDVPMGGAKKRSIGSQEKTSKDTPAADEKTKGEKKGPIKQKQKSLIVIEEPQGLKTIQSMKPITSQGLARSMGVKISIANSFLRSLESKGILRPIGGYSGHRIYELGPTEVT
ncbi:MAG: MarR family transcriptional regulator [Nitrosopumilales archaeon]|nr:MAG: MarR family transcriptional regulator [Nitrosopumilales archaeon]